MAHFEEAGSGNENGTRDTRISTQTNADELEQAVVHWLTRLVRALGVGEENHGRDLEP